MYRTLVLFLLFSGSAWGHQFTPTYPSFEYTHVRGVMSTQMELINNRMDVDYYEISVFDENWKEVAFVTESKVIPLPYLARKNITVYISERDRYSVKYICSQSKLLKGVFKSTMVSSKICSKVK